jgi:hypothetical protein
LRRRGLKVKIIAVFFAVVGAALFAILVRLVLDAKKAAFDGEFSVRENAFSEAKVKAYDKDGKEISVKSESVCEDKKDGYVLKNSTSSFALANGELLTISAKVAKAVARDQTQCEFIGAVKLTTESGLLMETEKLFADFNKKSASGDVEVAIYKGDAKLCSRRYFFDMNERVLTLTGDAKGFLKLNKIAADKLIVRFDDAEGKNIKNVDAEQNVVLFYKKEEKDYEIRSNFMRAFVNNGALDGAKANGSLTIKTKDAIIKAREGVLKGDKIDVFGDVAISGEQGNIFGNAATLDLKSGDIFIDQSSGVLDDGIRE